MIQSFSDTLSKALSGVSIMSEGKVLSDTEINTVMMAQFSRLKENSKKIMIIGNGGSAGIASHLAVDFWKNAGIRATAFNDSSLLTCVSNDFSYEEVFEKPIDMFADEGDLLFAISSSGNSSNILNGVKAAHKKGVYVVSLSGFKPDNLLRTSGDINIYINNTDYGIVEVSHVAVIHSLLNDFLEMK